MDTMKHMIKNNTFILIIFFLTGLSLSTFKGGVYIFPALILMYYIFFEKKHNKNKNLLILSILACSIGTVGAYLSNFNISDSVYFFRKAFFLLLIPSLINIGISQTKENFNANKLLIMGFFIGLILACVYSYYLMYISSHPFFTIESRSFWDKGRWRELLCYSIVLIFPLCFHKNTNKRIIFILFFILLLPSAIFTGGRIVYIAIFLTLGVFLIFYKRNLLIKSIVILTFLSAIVLATNNPISKNINHTIKTISNTSTNESNTARLEMYRNGILYIIDKAKNEPRDLLFGTQESNFKNKYTIFLTENIFPDINDRPKAFSLNDHHSAYMNNISKHGLLYSIAFYMLIISLIIKSIKISKDNVWGMSSFCLIICYLIVGTLYSNELSFQTVILFTLWCSTYNLAQNGVKNETNDNNK